MRHDTFLLFGPACLAVALALAAGGCGPCDCPPLTFNQRDGVGSFVGLSTDPTNPQVPPQVGPARIRAIRGEQITWVFRNPSQADVDVSLESVFDTGTTSPNILHEIFANTGGSARVEKNCGTGFLQARLNDRIQIGEGRVDSCAFRALDYFFLIRTATDSLRLEFSYDPELIIDGYP